MRKNAGMSLIEIIIFIVIIGIIVFGILSTLSIVLRNTTSIQRQSTAIQSVKKCLDFYLGSRYLKSYNAVSCPSTNVPAFCTVPAGYTIAADVSCLTLYGDTVSHYKQITITVGGNGNATESLILAEY